MPDGRTAASVMDPNPTSLHPDDRISEALEHIMKHRYRNIPVTDDEGRYLGVIGVNCVLRMVLPEAAVMARGLTEIPFINKTLADLRQQLQSAESKPVSTCMNTDLVSVPPDNPLVDTLLVLYRTNSSIPVVDPDTEKLVGMISYWDVGHGILSA